jgi:hypothetical protein
MFLGVRYLRYRKRQRKENMTHLPPSLHILIFSLGEDNFFSGVELPHLPILLDHGVEAGFDTDDNFPFVGCFGWQVIIDIGASRNRCDEVLRDRLTESDVPWTTRHSVNIGAALFCSASEVWILRVMAVGKKLQTSCLADAAIWKGLFCRVFGPHNPNVLTNACLRRIRWVYQCHAELTWNARSTPFVNLLT